LLSYRLLLKWQYYRFRRELLMLVTIQVLLGLGIVYGFALLLPDIDPQSAVYLATGSATLGLMVLGLTVVPQETSHAKLSGRHEYVGTLPVPRLAMPAAEVSWWLLVQLPGTVITLVVASLRFDIDFQLSWTVIPAIALVALTGASVGYALAAALRPEVANQIASFVTIGVLLFSPINYPADRLPGVLRNVHRFLPVEYMADVVRGSLTGNYATSSAGLAFAIVAAWCTVGMLISYRVAVRRR
jgi:ABC-2 type transport system permease protein